MPILRQASVALRALEFGRAPIQGVIRWADKVIASDPHAPAWLIELSLLKPVRFAEILQLLHQHAKAVETSEVDICILAQLYFANQLSCAELFQCAFEVCYGDYDTPNSEPIERLADLLCEWDQSDLPDPAQGDWQSRASAALVECQKASGELSQFISELCSV